jgi:hypothetical protein
MAGMIAVIVSVIRITLDVVPVVVVPMPAIVRPAVLMLVHDDFMATVVIVVVIVCASDDEDRSAECGQCHGIDPTQRNHGVTSCAPLDSGLKGRLVKVYKMPVLRVAGEPLQANDRRAEKPCILNADIASKLAATRGG